MRSLRRHRTSAWRLQPRSRQIAENRFPERDARREVMRVNVQGGNLVELHSVEADLVNDNPSRRVANLTGIPEEEHFADEWIIVIQLERPADLTRTRSEHLRHVIDRSGGEDVPELVLTVAAQPR